MVLCISFKSLQVNMCSVIEVEKDLQLIPKILVCKLMTITGRPSIFQFDLRNAISLLNMSRSKLMSDAR